MSKSKYVRVLVSAENSEQANTILDALLQKKLVAGGMITEGPAKVWWKGKVVEMEYYNISVLSKEKYKDAVITNVKQVSVEKVPMIAFFPLEGNRELLDWIDESTFHNNTPKGSGVIVG